jgi:hypothetical protein
MRRQLSLGLVVVIVACLIGWTATPPSQARVAWEYQEVQLASNAPSTPLLNQLGAAGWELVSVMSACPADLACSYWAYFKRPK